MRQPTPTYTIQQCTDALHCSRSYVERLINTGRVRSYKPTRRKVLVNAADFDALLTVPANNAVLR